MSGLILSTVGFDSKSNIGSSTNEKLDRSNFIEGTKLLGTYLYEVAAITSTA